MVFSSYRQNYSYNCVGDRNYGKKLYIFGSSGTQNLTVSGNSTLALADPESKVFDNVSQNKNNETRFQEDSKRRLQQLENVHKANLQGKEDTIANLRDIILQQEKHVLELESKTEGNITAREGQSGVREHVSPFQKLLEQIDSLQNEKDALLHKIVDLEGTEAGLGSLSYDTLIDLTELSELSYQMESCTTDTEKELVKIKRVNYSLTQEVQKLQKIGALLRDKLSSLGVDTSILMAPFNKSGSRYLFHETTGDITRDLLGDKGNHHWVSAVENQINCQHQEAEQKSLELCLGEDSKTQDSQRQILFEVLQKFQELKNAYVSLKQESKTIFLTLQDVMMDKHSQMQKFLADINAKHQEVVEKYLREMKLRKKYHNELVELRGNIRVLCRIRPWIKEDGIEENTIVVDVDSDDNSLIKVNNKGRTQFFDVDKAFDSESTQTQVFDEVSSLVRSVIDGYNVCIFAYGQTGSGKTYTMEGPEADPGLNQRALQLLFEETVDENWQYVISASVLEIYNEVIRDLLNPNPECKLEVKMKPEGGLYVPGLISLPVSDLTNVNQIFETGRKNRATASTNMNEHSSRSHCLLCITVTGFNPTTGSRSLGRLNLVDLAGSERVSKSLADGIHLKEAQNINKSLSSLGDVIHALRNKHTHVPYRNSKLTYLLQDSLGGDSKTLMIVQVAPVEKNVSETVCTLTFGQRVRSVELGAASKNNDAYRFSPVRRPSSLLSSSQSSPSLTSPASLTPTSPLSPLTQSSSSPSVSRRSFIIPPASPALSRRSPVTPPHSPLIPPSVLHRSTIKPSLSSPLLNGRSKLSASSPLSPTARKQVLSKMSPVTTPSMGRKLPLTPKSPSPVTFKMQNSTPLTTSSNGTNE